MYDKLTLSSQIAGDALSALAAEHWSVESRSLFSPELVVDIYTAELKGNEAIGPSPQRVALLEATQYLERYLWPNFEATSSIEHLMSILVLVNHKLNERTDPWTKFQLDQERFKAFFKCVLAVESKALTISERISHIVFVAHCFRSLENEGLRIQMLKLVSLPMWYNLSAGRLQLELKNRPNLTKKWNKQLKKDAKMKSTESKTDPVLQPEVTFLKDLIDLFLGCLDSTQSASGLQTTFCERSLEFLTDLLSQLPTRRFLKIVLQENAIAIKCKLSRLYSLEDAVLFRQLVDNFVACLDFNVDEHSGEPFSEEEYLSHHYERLTQLQRLMFKYWNEKLHDYTMTSCSHLQQQSTLLQLTSSLSIDELQKLVITQLKLINPDDDWKDREEFLKDVFVSQFQKRQLQREDINAMPLYPTEAIFWERTKIPDPKDIGDVCLPLPKLNLQFLSMYDYLVRNFELYRLEAAYEIQEDLGDVLSRVGPTADDDNKVEFRGWARMAIPITGFAITEVQQPHVGYDKPAVVKAEIVFSLERTRADVRGEWDELKQHDVIFLIALDPNRAQELDGVTPKDQYGLTHVRGCEVLEVKDEEGKIMNDVTSRRLMGDRPRPTGTKRRLTVLMDTAQYHADVTSNSGEAMYETFSLLMRRRPKENNFKSVLECIRDVMNEDRLGMEWLQDVFLGYGHPSAAHYSMLPETHLLEFNTKDTFLDFSHIKESFPEYTLLADNDQLSPPFKLTFSTLPGLQESDEKIIKVEHYVQPISSPFPQMEKKQNSVRFTPVQIEAVMSGMQNGLTLIVGPPGTGKTDTAVQILHMLYHNYPNQRTLLLTHSNHALNDLFQKLMERDIPGRYLIRLGMGEQELETEMDFSRGGRVDAMLARRLEILSQLRFLAKTMKVSEDMAYSCETAGHFWTLHVLPKWEKFLTQCRELQGELLVIFPFAEFFSSAPEPLFEGKNRDNDIEKAEICFRYLKGLFEELEECRAFELLKTQYDRVNYLLTKHVRIVAMTCTHAALKRKEFLKIGLQYDTVVMEEAGQVLEIETCIPWTLQRNGCRLQRVVLIGDHHQLPPVVKHPALGSYGRLDQSLFARFVRLGMPFVELNAQGRCRPSIAQLFNWRYSRLGDLPEVQQGSYLMANPGFAFDFQFVDVIDPNGQGESTPTPFFYQNLAEAEFVVSVYQYMRLLGYPASKISILTTYNGQKHLLRDVLSKRCRAHPAFGSPHKVTTVDKYQGQQNDYVLLSLVRTNAVGHLRDVRRLIVATSRARLGCYVFGSASLFRDCFEIQPTFHHWNSRPMMLGLVRGEAYSACTRRLVDGVETVFISGLQEINVLVQQMTLEWEHAAQAS